MEQVLQEINKHKTKLISLINNLINTELINEEIFINNEIKKESEYLIPLLNVKQNILMNPINLNNNINFNPLLFQPNPMMINNLAINQMQPQFIINDFPNKNVDNIKIINVHLQNNVTGKITNLICNPNEIISEIIKRYREKSNDYEEIKLLCDGKDLNPSSTLSECGIFNNKKIIVYHQGNLKGAKLGKIKIKNKFNKMFHFKK